MRIEIQDDSTIVTKLPKGAVASGTISAYLRNLSWVRHVSIEGPQSDRILHLEMVRGAEPTEAEIHAAIQAAIRRGVEGAAEKSLHFKVVDPGTAQLDLATAGYDPKLAIPLIEVFDWVDRVETTEPGVVLVHYDSKVSLGQLRPRIGTMLARELRGQTRPSLSRLASNPSRRPAAQPPAKPREAVVTESPLMAVLAMLLGGNHEVFKIGFVVDVELSIRATDSHIS